ncbi:MAG: hypothetical protein AAF847_16095 [Bacteroidota bacterium]
MKENIKKYLELTETPTPPMHLENEVMEKIRTYQAKREERLQSLRWAILLTALSVILFILLLLYGEQVFSVLSKALSLPDISQQMLTAMTVGSLFFLLAFVDPILSLYMRRKYRRS